MDPHRGGRRFEGLVAGQASATSYLKRREAKKTAKKIAKKT